MGTTLVEFLKDYTTDQVLNAAATVLAQGQVHPDKVISTYIHAYTLESAERNTLES